MLLPRGDRHYACTLLFHDDYVNCSVHGYGIASDPDLKPGSDHCQRHAFRHSHGYPIADGFADAHVNLHGYPFPDGNCFPPAERYPDAYSDLHAILHPVPDVHTKRHAPADRDLYAGHAFGNTHRIHHTVPESMI